MVTASVFFSKSFWKKNSNSRFNPLKNKKKVGWDGEEDGRFGWGDWRAWACIHTHRDIKTQMQRNFLLTVKVMAIKSQ